MGQRGDAATGRAGRDDHFVAARTRQAVNSAKLITEGLAAALWRGAGGGHSKLLVEIHQQHRRTLRIFAIVRPDGVTAFHIFMEIDAVAILDAARRGLARMAGMDTVVLGRSV